MKKPFLLILLAVLLILGIVIGYRDNGPRKLDSGEVPSRFDE